MALGYSISSKPIEELSGALIEHPGNPDKAGAILSGVVTSPMDLHEIGRLFKDARRRTESELTGRWGMGRAIFPRPGQVDRCA